MCGCLSHAPHWGTWPATQTCALTGNRTDDPLVCRPALNPLSHTGQGLFMGFIFLSLFSILCPRPHHIFILLVYITLYVPIIYVRANAAEVVAKDEYHLASPSQGIDLKTKFWF